MEKGFVYGHRNKGLGLKDEGDNCGKNRVYNRIKGADIKSLGGYKRHPSFAVGEYIIY